MALVGYAVPDDHHPHHVGRQHCGEDGQRRGDEDEERSKRALHIPETADSQGQRGGMAHLPHGPRPLPQRAASVCPQGSGEPQDGPSLRNKKERD